MFPMRAMCQKPRRKRIDYSQRIWKGIFKNKKLKRVLQTEKAEESGG